MQNHEPTGEAPVPEKPLSPSHGELLWRTLGRYDHYNATVDQKASALIAYNTLVGGALAVMVSWANPVSRTASRHPVVDGIAYGAVIGALVATAISLLWALSAIWPHLAGGTHARSALYFEDVAAHGGPDAYLLAVRRIAESALGEDLAHQVFYVARGTSRKLGKVRSAIRAIGFQVALGATAGVAHVWTVVSHVAAR